MKFGIAFANTGPFVAPEGASAIAEAAEQSGFDSLWTVEHVVVPREYASTYPYSPTGKMPGGSDFDIPDPLIWLTWVAARTTTLRLGTGVLILPQRNPVILAKEVATLDLLSGGRVLLGVGIGWLEEEFDILGASFPDRGPRTEEYIEAMRELWSQDLSTFAGETVSFTEAISRPRPVDRSVPVHIGGHSPAAARRAGRVGDGFFPAKGDVPALVGEMRKAAEQAGRDPDAIEVTASGADTLGGGEAALDVIGRMAELGVSRLIVPPLAYDPAAIGDALGRYGEDVIARAG
jgi:probable F420-dependent oxidoreductase